MPTCSTPRSRRIVPCLKKLVSQSLTLRSLRVETTVTERQMRDMNFPLWRRLHIYWRTLPQYNQFWKGTSTSSSSTTPGFQSSLPRTPTQNRFRPRPGNSENDLIYVSSREPSGGGRKGSSVSRSSRSASLDYSYRDRLDTARPRPPTDRRPFTFVASFSIY